MPEGKFIAYYRVSTERQGRSGLGLDAQKTAVRAYLNGGDWQLIEEVVEVESGKKNERPALQAALKACRRQKATLVIAKLDRLSRNLAFIANLMESGVEFVATDMPHANRTMLQIMAVFAEHEREMISKRTKEALAAVKARGVRLGSPDPRRGSASGNAVKSEAARRFAANVGPIIDQIKNSGAATLRAVATALDARGIRAPRGGCWSAAAVRRVIEKCGTEER
ncbi:MAG: recombinase family protein [Rhodospirillales bacterium]|nr:recombinase family protein [Rhodospirillales bacterium]